MNATTTKTIYTVRCRDCYWPKVGAVGAGSPTAAKRHAQEKRHNVRVVGTWTVEYEGDRPAVPDVLAEGVAP